MYELFYSDGCVAKERFTFKNKAIEKFYKKKKEKGMQRVALYKAGIGFHSTTQVKRVIMFWNDQYLIAKSLNNKELEGKRVL